MRRGAALAAAGPLKRCAIYTRKSVAAGLEHEFNSLDAQREACEQYIRSQSGSGWQALETHYDDGGYTGANLERPAFARLLTDIEARQVDVVVCYKIDRLSRSLLDFTTVMKRLNEAGVGFVSVTQNFSTTDATGRLTLNLLATFAEFEREQIAERTRDKMAAARRRGMWTGGPVPLGYRVVGKKLVVEELEAVLVREIFDLYLSERAVLSVVRLLAERGRATKRHLAVSGRMREARAWDKGDVLRVLKNPIYAGYMPYRDELHEGHHEPIVDRDLFHRVRAVLAERRTSKRRQLRNPDFLLGGILFCAHCGSALTPSSTAKGKREYRYYRCVRRDRQGRAACVSKQVSAPQLEGFVVERIREALAETDLAGDILVRLRNRTADKRRDLAIERQRLPGEIASASADGKRLVDKLGEVAEAGAKRLLDEKLAEVGAHLLRLERRLADVEREIGALDAAEVEAEWVTGCLREFDGVWEVLTPENRGRLLRTVLERITYDCSARKVSVVLADLGTEAAEALA